MEWWRQRNGNSSSFGNVWSLVWRDGETWYKECLSMWCWGGWRQIMDGCSRLWMFFKSSWHIKSNTTGYYQFCRAMELSYLNLNVTASSYKTSYPLTQKLNEWMTCIFWSYLNLNATVSSILNPIHWLKNWMNGWLLYFLELSYVNPSVTVSLYTKSYPLTQKMNEWMTVILS